MIDIERGWPAWVLGLMSGASIDRVDAELVRDRGRLRPVGFLANERAQLRAVPAMMEDPMRFARFARGEDRATIAEAAAEVTRCTRAASSTCCARGGRVPAGADRLPGPDDRALSGEAVDLADRRWQRAGAGAERPVVWDFRSEDVRQGGQGAPLAPFYHFALAQRIGATEPLAFLNIGGVANVTWVDPRRTAPEEEGALVAAAMSAIRVRRPQGSLGRSGRECGSPPERQPT